MKRVKKDQAFFTALFTDKAEAYAKYVNENKVSFKNEDQIAKMVNFLNAL